MINIKTMYKYYIEKLQLFNRIRFHLIFYVLGINLYATKINSFIHLLIKMFFLKSIFFFLIYDSTYISKEFNEHKCYYLFLYNS